MKPARPRHRKDTAHRETEKLRALQQIAKAAPHAAQPPSDGIEATNAMLAAALAQIGARIRELSDYFKVQPRDIIAWLRGENNW